MPARSLCSVDWAMFSATRDPGQPFPDNWLASRCWKYVCTNRPGAVAVSSRLHAENQPMRSFRSGSDLRILRAPRWRNEPLDLRISVGNRGRRAEIKYGTVCTRIGRVLKKALALSG